MKAEPQTVVPSFKTIHASVRPGRVAILTDRVDDHWQDTCLRIIEFFSRLWGGAYNLIVPTDGKTIDEKFWAILEAFDPDYVYCYRKSGEDIRLSTPNEYNKIVDEHIRSHIGQFGQGSADDLQRAEKEIDENLRGACASSFEVTPELQNEIKVRLSPFYFQQWIVEAGAISSSSGVSFPLTSLAKIFQNTSHPDKFATLNVSPDLLPRLWYSAVCGALCEAGIKELEAMGTTQHRLDFREGETSELMEFVMTGETRGPWTYQPSKSALTNFNAIAPFPLSMLQLGLYRPAKFQYWNEPLIFVTGNRLEDFCLYYCLSRLRERVVWVLPSITEKALNLSSAVLGRAELSFIALLRKQKYSQKSQAGLAHTSFSLSDPEQTTVVEWLNSSPLGKLDAVSKAKQITNLVQAPLVAIERDNLQRDVPVQLSDGMSISPFNTPKPKNFTSIHPYEHRYIAQLSVAQEAPPKHYALGEWVISDRRFTTHEVRIGRDGPAYFCPKLPTSEETSIRFW